MLPKDDIVITMGYLIVMADSDNLLVTITAMVESFEFLKHSSPRHLWQSA